MASKKLNGTDNDYLKLNQECRNCKRLKYSGGQCNGLVF